MTPDQDSVTVITLTLILGALLLWAYKKSGIMLILWFSGAFLGMALAFLVCHITG